MCHVLSWKCTRDNVLNHVTNVANIAGFTTRVHVTDIYHVHFLSVYRHAQLP